MAVYFAQAADGPIKIGFSKGDVRARIRQLATGSPSPLGLLAVMPGDRSDEASLHCRFHSERIAGEWFRPSAELLAYIASVREHNGVPNFTPRPRNRIHGVVQRFGSQATVAAIVGLGQPSISLWVKRNAIPIPHYVKLLTAARNRGVDLTLAELDPDIARVAGEAA